jgi:uncharacterized membrane protein (DUF485 family)
MAERHSRPRQWREIGWKAGRVAFWWAICELCLFFLYFGAISLDPQFMDRLPKDQFVSIGMAMGSSNSFAYFHSYNIFNIIPGAFFHLKYVVIFGLPAIFAHLDGLRPPLGPICISRISLYSKIWRGFDRGLYAFFKEYIFVPICRPTFSLPRKMFGLCVSFTFVLLWHGFHHHNLVWIALNIAELFIESVKKEKDGAINIILIRFGAKAFYSLPAVRLTRERSTVLSPLYFAIFPI